MMETAKIEAAKPGRKNHTPEIIERLDAIENLLAKLAHYQGGSCVKLVEEAGFGRYQPTLKDMNKHR